MAPDATTEKIRDKIVNIYPTIDFNSPIYLKLIKNIYLFFISLIADGPSTLQFCLWSSHLSAVHTTSDLTSRQPMVEFYLLTYSCVRIKILLRQESNSRLPH